MAGILPKTKTGNCSCGCGGIDVPVVKVGKQTWCLMSYRKQKTKQYEAKARQNSKVRMLGKEQVRDGNYFNAERQALINDLDFVTSRIVRLRAADNNGMISCYTCTRPVHWSLAQCSHFIKRSDTELRFDLKWNLRASCRHCNEVLGGNLTEYAKRLNEEQSGIAEELEELSKQVYKWTREELKQLLIDYRGKLRVLEDKFKNIEK